MKKTILILIASLSALTSYGQHTVKLSDPTVRLILNGMESVEELPFYEDEGLTIPLSLVAETLDFGIYTDIESVVVSIPFGESETILLVKEGYMPLTIILSNMREDNDITFDVTDSPRYTILYDTDPDNPYLKTLREQYSLASVIADCETDLKRVQAMSAWVHSLWDHNGWNEPSNPDALTILKEVAEGQQFRCVEYGIVTAACLNAVGLPARTLWLKAQDCQTRESGAGHVVMEVYLTDTGKWAMVDPQFDAMAFINGIPLNAVEFQRAITQNAPLETNLSSEAEQTQYIGWIYPYLYYFNVDFDNREGVSGIEAFTVDGKRSLMLVPEGAPQPTVFQNTMPIDYCVYTNSYTDFYSAPQL